MVILLKLLGVIEINKDAVHNGACEGIYEDLVESIKDAMEFEDPDSDDDGIEDDSDDDNDGIEDDSDGDDNGGDDN
jgi:hypothetical protein